MKTAVIVNVTPSPTMMIQAHVLAKSLAVNSGLQFEFIWVWDHNYEYDQVVEHYPWLTLYPHRAVKTPKPYNDALGYVGNFLHRFELNLDHNCLIIADADTFVLGDLSRISQFAVEDNALLGVGAGTFINDVAEKCFAAANVRCPNYDVPFMHWGVWGEPKPETQFMPPHFNCGFLYMTPEVMNSIGKYVYEDTLLCKRVANHVLHTQMGIMLSIVRSGEKYHSINHKYNMTFQGHPPEPLDPSNVILNAKHRRMLDAINDVKVGHYCVKTKQLDKDHDFSSYDALEQMLERNMGWSLLGRKLQKFLEKHLDAIVEEAK